MIGIIDYGFGNVRAFANVYKNLDIPALIVRSAADLDRVSRIIIPGVGAFDHTMACLRDSGLRDRLDELVLHRRVPVLGVCVGMQMLTRASEEGTLAGLQWIDGEVNKFDLPLASHELSVPHMGWNDVRPLQTDDLFRGLGEGARFYFLHSYYVACQRADDVIAVTDYGGEFTCAVRHDNIFGVQFHPEKSHHYGVQLLKNFAGL